MLPATRELIDEAAARTGKPIHVLTDAALEVSASIQIARHGAPQHVLRVRPSEAADYFIANQVLFMLRLLELSVEDRFDFSPAPAADAAMAETLRGSLGPGGPEIGNDGPLVKNFTRWALMQLRSIPIGMRVDQQIFRDMPLLRTSLQAGFKEQNQSNLAAIQRLGGVASLPERYLRSTRQRSRYAARRRTEAGRGRQPPAVLRAPTAPVPIPCRSAAGGPAAHCRPSLGGWRRRRRQRAFVSSGGSAVIRMRNTAYYFTSMPERCRTKL